MASFSLLAFLVKMTLKIKVGTYFQTISIMDVNLLMTSFSPLAFSRENQLKNKNRYILSKDFYSSYKFVDDAFYLACLLAFLVNLSSK